MNHLSYSERVKIELYLKDGVCPYRIACILGRSPRTIYQEIKRGSHERLNSDLTVSTVYSYDVGERIRSERSHNKGRCLAIGNNQLLADSLEDLIINKRLSPYAALEVCRNKGICVNICLTTLYSYIHKKLFCRLSDKNLKKYRCKYKKSSCRLHSLKNLSGRSISQRPEYINKRLEFGHWEMDTVCGALGSEAVFFVLTERLSRFELISMQPHKSIDCCKAFLDSLEYCMGLSFYKYFKSITCDNGSEFLSSAAIEDSFLNPSIKRTVVYYCHAYASSERGSNENNNKIIRYFIPKGSDISLCTPDQVANIQDYMNNLPRKLFGGLSSAAVAAVFGFQ